jgi:hypothetical protein
MTTEIYNDSPYDTPKHAKDANIIDTQAVENACRIGLAELCYQFCGE